MNQKTLVFTCITFLCISFSYGQSQQIAEKYFKKSEFEKAYEYYSRDYEKSPSTYTLKRMVECKQQLEDYKTAQHLLEKHQNIYHSPEINVLLGYNLQLQGKKEKAYKQYEKSISSIEKNPGYAYSVGVALQNYSLPEYALRAYKKGMMFNKDLNLEYLIGTIYGEMSDIKNMFKYYLDYLERNPNSKSAILIKIKEFISHNPEDENNIDLKNALLLRSQNTPNPIWNDLLSWLFIRQKQYKKAFIQLRSVYLREKILGTFSSIYKLGLLARENGDIENATRVQKYLTENAPKNIQIEAHLQLIEMDEMSGKRNSKIEEIYRGLVKKMGKYTYSIPLLKAYAEFVGYKKHDFSLAKRMIKECVDISQNENEKMQLKILLGDMSIYFGEYNQGLIYYAQVQNNMKNEPIGQLASFKIAQTAFFRGDFSWAESQLNILKSASSQMIANDALQLKWLITDNNIKKDSSQVALKLYAKATLLDLRKKTDEAISTLDTIIMSYSNQPIEDDALLKQGSLLEKKKKYELAAKNYQKIIDLYQYDIYADDAIYRLANIYDKFLKNKTKAQKFYEQIIDNHSDSVYYMPSRKRYRILRGDSDIENL